jgi:hypothetical protein
MSAGDGYKYLLRTVAAGDGDRSLSTPLTRYYNAEGTPPGRWLGAGVAGLGGGQIVEGDQVSEAQLQLLVGMGRDPITGKPLGRAYPEYQSVAERVADLDPALWPASRAEAVVAIESEETERGTRRADAGYDFTFSVPKSASVLWAVADAGTQSLIGQAHHAAVAEVVAFMERSARLNEDSDRARWQLMTEPTALKLWDDNPSVIDLLGFDAVVEPIVEAIGTADVDPLAIGVHSPWGGGKSTVLNLLEKRLETGGRYVVIRTDPWQYDNHDDVRGSLIAEVLDQLGSTFNADGTIKGRITDLVKRISWTRVGLALGKGALAMQWNPDELIDAFTPRGRSDDKSMAGFKDAFNTLVKGLPDIDRVVVLVDDLDRCLPPAVMATLEGIKLFLAVRSIAPIEGNRA